MDQVELINQIPFQPYWYNRGSNKQHSLKKYTSKVILTTSPNQAHIQMS